MIGQNRQKENKRLVIYVANTSWYLYNFRLPLLKRMVQKGWRVLAVAPKDNYSNKFKDFGIEFIHLDQSRKVVSPLADLRFTRQLFNLYRVKRPSLVHHFTIKPVNYGSIVARLTGVKGIVNSVTGLGYMFMTPGMKATILRHGICLFYRLNLATKRQKAIFQNPDDLDLFLSLGLVKKERTVLIKSSGVDIQKFVPSVEPLGDPVILFSCRMLWDKGTAELIDAVRLLKKWGVKANVVFAGGVDAGNPTAIPEVQLRAWQSEGIIQWLGHQENIEQIYSRSHIVVLPSYREGVPKSLLEAAACGRPLVATDVPGCREIVRHGENGLLVPPKSVEPLAMALKTLIENPGLRNEMGARSRTIAEAEFSQEKVITETLAVYQSLLSDSQ
ncbi:MAG: glycosyltransferase family 4 protein [Nitrospiria bacterium]